jgi:hypothetical protein
MTTFITLQPTVRGQILKFEVLPSKMKVLLFFETSGTQRHGVVSQKEFNSVLQNEANRDPARVPFFLHVTLTSFTRVYTLIISFISLFHSL